MAGLGDLTLGQRSEVQKVEGSYAKWWDSVRFRKGWSTPPVSFEQMRPILTKAAEVVVRVRSVLDACDPSFKMRRVEGCSYAYFADLTPNSLLDPMALVSGIVHATFKDGPGTYTEGLTEVAVDDFLRQCAQHWDAEGTSLPRLSPEPEPSPPALSEVKAEMIRKLQATLMSLNELPDDEGMMDGLREAMVHLEKGQSILDSLSTQTRTQPHPQPTAQQDAENTDLEVVEMSDSDTDSRRASSPSPSPPFHLGSALEEEEDEANFEENYESSSESMAPESELGEERTWVDREFDMDKFTPRAAESASEGPIADPEEGSEEGSDEEEGSRPPTPPATPEPEPEPLTPEQIEAKQEFDRKLQAVRSEVERLSRAEAAVGEAWTSLDKLTWTAHKEAGRVHRQCLQISEELMKAMLSLDQLSSPCPESRKERKQQVVAIQRQLDSMDATTDNIREGMESLEATHQIALSDKKAEFITFCQKMGTGDFAELPQIEPKLELEDLNTAYTVKCHLEGWPEGTVSASLSSVNTLNDTGVIKGTYYPTLEFANDIARQGVAKIESGEEAALTGSPLELMEKVAGARFGTFTKSFPVPNDALWNQGTIKFTRGRLLLTIPKDSPWRHGGMRWM